MRGSANPYRPPADSSSEVEHDFDEAASRGARLGAAIFDGIATAVILTPLHWKLGTFDDVQHALTWGQHAYVAVLGFFLWTLVQLAFLRHGRTIGKTAFRIQMVDAASGAEVPVGRLVLLRYLPVGIAATIPQIGFFLVVVDALFIFGAQRRCVHDLIAGTRVVNS